MNRAIASVLAVAMAPGVVFLAAACGRDDVIIARYLDAGVEAGNTCRGDAGSCGPGEFCSMAWCDAATTGTCEPIPDAASCPSSFEPVCGCDDVSYFNDCLRKASAQPAMSPNACSNAGPNQSCDFLVGSLPVSRQCPKGTTCAASVLPAGVRDLAEGFAQFFSKQVDGGEPVCRGLSILVPPGSCWRLPETCAGEGGTVQDLCDPRPCAAVDACEAIRHGGGFYGQWSCP